MTTGRLVTPGRALELIEALDGYNALDEIERSLITRWAAGEDVNDVRKFEAPRVLIATIILPAGTINPPQQDLGSLAIAMEGELLDGWFQTATQVNITEVSR